MPLVASCLPRPSRPRDRWRVCLAGALLALAFATGGDARSLQRVTFVSQDRGENGAPVSLQALLLLPDGPVPQGGFPAIVALHGCSGMYSTVKGREEQLAERLMIRADMLLGEGYALLFPDSYGPRGRKEVCTIKLGERSVTPAQRRLDALAALAYLGTRKDIARDRIALVGWSHGGSTTLAAINTRDREVAAFLDRYGGHAFFRAAVAFYPGCGASLKAGERWEPGVPTRVLIGELDDWTPAKPCVDLGQAMVARGEPLKVTVYPDSHHGFDAPGTGIVHRTDVPNGVNPGQGVHVGPNSEMRDKANAKLRAFLQEQLRPSP